MCSFITLRRNTTLSKEKQNCLLSCRQDTESYLRKVVDKARCGFSSLGPSSWCHFLPQEERWPVTQEYHLAQFAVTEGTPLTVSGKQKQCPFRRVCSNASFVKTSAAATVMRPDWLITTCQAALNLAPAFSFFFFFTHYGQAYANLLVTPTYFF